MKKIFYIITLLFINSLFGFANELALIDASWLAQHLDDDNLVVLDVRKEKNYEKSHIPSAVHTNYKEWRTERNGLPGYIPEDKEYLENLVGSLGITEHSHVVVVSGIDRSGDFGTAARVYWTLKIVGLDKLSILDGGFRQWNTQDFEVSDTPTIPVPTSFTIQEDYLNNTSLLASEDAVQTAIKKQNHILVDARPEDFYLGHKKHPLADIGGTIKDSINVSQFSVQNKDGTLKSKEEIETILEPHNIVQNKGIISFCNTGHWASTNWFVLSELLGYDVSLYDGSFVEWSANKDNQIQNKKVVL